jgi:glutamine amidotransferase
MVVHARSAFRNEGVVVENNMPFVDGDLAFAFNGELRGVRLSTPGATGAWRLFHLLGRFQAGAAGDGARALRRLDALIAERAEYVRALNIVSSDGERVWVHGRFSEDPDYFTLHRAEGGGVTLVSSERFQLLGREAFVWEPIPNGSTFELGERVPC